MSATKVSMRPELGPSSTDSREGSQAPPQALFVAVVATALALVVFLLLQTLLAAYSVSVARDAAERGVAELGWWERSVVSRLFPSSIPGAISFVALAIGGSVLAGRGSRVLFALPAIAFVFAHVAVSPHQPEAIGWQWSVACFEYDITYTTCALPWFGHPWLGPTVDLLLVVVPGFAIARRVRTRRAHRLADPVALAATLACAAAVATAVWAMIVIQNGVDARSIAAVAALGLVMGAPRPWWPWFHVLVSLALAQSFAWLLDFVFYPEPTFPFKAAWPFLLGDTWPIVAVALVASAWQPLAWLIRRLQDRPLRLVIAVNALNAADALLTFLAVRSGGAYEANPIVRIVGLPMKIAIVGAITWLIFKRKPSALVWPFAVLTWVIGYHVAGILVNGWR